MSELQQLRNIIAKLPLVHSEPRREGGELVIVDGCFDVTEEQMELIYRIQKKASHEENGKATK